MASLLNRILTLLGRAASDAVSDALSQKSSTPSGTSDSTPSGSAEPAQSRAPKSSAAKPSPTRTRSHDSGAGAGTTAPSSRGVGVYDVSTLGLPDFSYSPDPDGDADPGEVVWAWVPFEEDPTQGKDRPVLVLARHETRLVVAQMTSKDHDRDAAQEARWGRFWHDVGTGDWDHQGRPSEVRLDRLLLVEPASVRREGATMRREVFDGVVAALRRHHS
ncbi:type II toxin-antitoxin system PemK/MazF family toxin [Actinomyces oris]|uniref:Growth inhibitor PemK n=1 Tax=Actinomyces oris TaxID=544580 RepID=A0A1Q8VAR5_9ACTO|nr:type II toxin-antitoxin system PemK/MazF family toxin [Actinomyces oris]OLO45154.1 growth inhibitor PemK [Actinomyces oris]